MKSTKLIFLSIYLLIEGMLFIEVPREENHSELLPLDTARGRRDVIEEEKFYEIHSDNRKDNNINQPLPWLPGSFKTDEVSTTKAPIVNYEPTEVLPLFQTTERVTDKPTGRGARASNDNWIKLPFPDHDLGDRDDILTPPQPSGELINSRMPRINFVTQNKALETSESRNDKETIQRTSRNDENIRTEFVRPDEEDRKPYKPVYPRQAVYYPQESRRPYFEERYIPADDLYRRDPYYDIYDRRRPYYAPYGPRVDRYDEAVDSAASRKPKRIIYYAHLPEVVRTPPSVDLRYRYSVDPYRRLDDEYNARNGRYDYRFRNRYPYAPLRKEERNYRDLAGAGTVNKDKKAEEKVTPTAVLPQKEDKYKHNVMSNRDVSRNLINSHQYHDAVDGDFSDALTHKGFQDVVRQDDGYLRYEEPLFQGAIDNPYQRKY